MRESGCVQILVGLESPTPDGLNGIELNRNWKHERFDRYKEAIERIQSNGILVTGCFVLGLDGHTPAVFEDVHRFVEESGVGEVQITVMTAFPGTPLYDRLDANGRLLDRTAWEKCTLFDVNVRPKGMSVSELERGLLELGQRLYSAEEKKARNRAFRRQYQKRWHNSNRGGNRPMTDKGIYKASFSWKPHTT